MSLGPGKYDQQLTEALRSAGAKEGTLLVINGPDHSGFSCQCKLTSFKLVIKGLRQIADQMEQDLQEIERKK